MRMYEVRWTKRIFTFKFESSQNIKKKDRTAKDTIEVLEEEIRGLQTRLLEGKYFGDRYSRMQSKKKS